MRLFYVPFELLEFFGGKSARMNGLSFERARTGCLSSWSLLISLRQQVVPLISDINYSHANETFAIKIHKIYEDVQCVLMDSHLSTLKKQCFKLLHPNWSARLWIVTISDIVNPRLIIFSPKFKNVQTKRSKYAEFVQCIYDIKMPEYS